MHLYLIRHADPDYERDTLTRQGFRETRALAGRMKNVGLTHVYSSPLPRAMLTAQAIVRRGALPIVQQKWLVEPTHLTVVQGGTIYKMWDTFGEDVRSGQAPPTQEAWNRVPPFDAAEVSEMWRGFRRDADELLARHGFVREGSRYRIRQRSTDRVAIVCHNGTILLFLAHLLELPLPLAWCGFYAWPASVTVFLMEEHSPTWAVPRALQVADVSHLFAARLSPQPRAFGDGAYTAFL